MCNCSTNIDTITHEKQMEYQKIGEQHVLLRKTVRSSHFAVKLLAILKIVLISGQKIDAD